MSHRGRAAEPSGGARRADPARRRAALRGGRLTHSGRFSKPSAAGRTRLLLTLIERVREACPGLLIGVRLSLFDTVPWHMVEGRGAAFPPSDGYPPPEDPLVGCWRQIDAARQAKAAVPDLVMVGTAYTYLQDYVVHAAQATVRQGWIDGVGLGRMVLSYPELPADSLAATAERIRAAGAELDTPGRGRLADASRPILLAVLIAVFNQLSGIDAVLYFAPRIFELAGRRREVVGSA